MTSSEASQWCEDHSATVQWTAAGARVQVAVGLRGPCGGVHRHTLVSEAPTWRSAVRAARDNLRALVQRGGGDACPLDG